jgi:ATP synthase protein I
MNNPEARDPLRDLEERLERARRSRTPPPSRTEGDGEDAASRRSLALAFRIGLELVTAVVVGVAIGWAFDRWLGTRPWGMIGFFFLGVGAGMTNVYRAVTGLNRAVGYRRPGNAPLAAKTQTGWDEDED